MPLRRRNSPQLEGVDSAELAMLPRLPDTADELELDRAALEADPCKVLNLGKDANEKKVKSLDLSGFKILAFATHGLVPGELNGLRQPALALSAPDVSGRRRRRAADHGGNPRAQARRRLGRAVGLQHRHRAPARARKPRRALAARSSMPARARCSSPTGRCTRPRRASSSATCSAGRPQDAKITRGEALRQAMIALIDGEGFKDDKGKTLFAYAHPLFWAPYTIIGDGGVN